MSGAKMNYLPGLPALSLAALVFSQSAVAASATAVFELEVPTKDVSAWHDKETWVYFYDGYGKVIAKCQSDAPAVGTKGWLDFSCGLDGGITLSKAAWLEVVSDEASEFFYVVEGKGGAWDLVSVVGASVGFFQIDLGDEEPNW